MDTRPVEALIVMNERSPVYLAASSERYARRKGRKHRASFLNFLKVFTVFSLIVFIIRSIIFI